MAKDKNGSKFQMGLPTFAIIIGVIGTLTSVGVCLPTTSIQTVAEADTQHDKIDEDAKTAHKTLKDNQDKLEEESDEAHASIRADMKEAHKEINDSIKAMQTDLSKQRTDNYKISSDILLELQRMNSPPRRRPR